ncbi:MAG TPA: ATP-binding protein [Pirellulales bacterium]|nr:ATP-binding protein [Pirellulales bacterium]
MNSFSDHSRSAVKQPGDVAFRSLVEAAECMIVIVREDRSIAYFSRFAESLTGYAAEDVENLDFCGTFVPPAQQTAFANELRRAWDGEPRRGFEGFVVCHDGTVRWMLWNARRLVGESGDSAVLAVGQDITDLKRVQDQLLQSERLAAIGQMVAGLAHESRNALQRSQACLGMLAKRIRDQPEALEFVAGIQQAQDDLYRLYEGVRGYTAPIRLKRERCDLGQVLHEAWSQLDSSRRGREARFREHGDRQDLACDVDRFAAAQVFRNVLENSLSATRGTALIDITWSAGVLEQVPALRVALCDDGPGLNDEQRRRIFEPFYTTKTHGTGLGMAISKRIVDAHGGRIAVDPTRDCGTKIVIDWRRRA